jgi:tetratricopeptide (TPR) repeat protein
LKRADENKDVYMRAYCLLGLASIAIEHDARALATKYLRQATESIAAFGATSPAATRLAAREGRLALAEGNLAQAREQLARALANGNRDSTTVEVLLDQSRLDLLSNDVNAAIDHSHQALRLAQSLQDAAPYSNYTGLAWLTLARALERRGDHAAAREAMAAAAANLSNTVDVSHPALLQAREYLEK